jgi:hypothetical protein
MPHTILRPFTQLLAREIRALMAELQFLIIKAACQHMTIRSPVQISIPAASEAIHPFLDGLSYPIVFAEPSPALVPFDDALSRFIVMAYSVNITLIAV